VKKGQETEKAAKVQQKDLRATDRQIDGWMDGWMGGWMAVMNVVVILFSINVSQHIKHRALTVSAVTPVVMVASE
jgi:hypothetical protein